MATEPTSTSQGGADRRDFLKSCGRFAVTVPPAMTVLLSTSLSSQAIARSVGGDTGNPHADHPRPKTDYPRPKTDTGRNGGGD